MATHVDELRAEIAAGRVVVLAGAGVAIASVPATQRELAGWRGLLASGIEYVSTAPGIELDEEAKTRWLASARSKDPDELVSVAQFVGRKLEAPSGGEFRRWLRETVGGLELADHRVVDAILALRCPVLTTNYDSLLEQASGLEAVTWRDSNSVQRVVRGEQEGILHLHGHWEDPESVVLGWSSYERLANDEHAQLVQQAIGLARTMLYVGFGGAIDDPTFGPFFRWYARVFPGSEVRHYRLCREGERAELVQRHPAEHRLVVLPYGKEHQDLAPFLQTLAPPGAPSPRRPFAAPSVEAPDPRLVPLLLAGAYDEGNAHDCELLEQLAGRPYADVIETLSRHARRFDRKGGVVTFLAPDRAFGELGDQLGQVAVDQFKKAAVAVLSEVHPRFTLPPEERFYAGVQGLVLRHSAELRAGLAASVARLATRLGPAPQLKGRPEDHAATIVAELLRRAPWQRWATLGSDLASLAEAAPDTFLEAVEGDLYSPKPQLPELLKDEPGLAGLGGSHRMGLLHALETLGWAPEHLPRVAQLLAELAQLDPGSRYANGPRSSLLDLFRVWNPQTRAGPEVRQATLEGLARRHGDTGFLLLRDLVPERYETQAPGARPRFRPWGPGTDEHPNQAQVQRDFVFVVRLLLTLASERPTRWMGLLEKLENLPPEARAATFDGVRRLVASGLAPADEGELRGRLVKLLDRHVTHRNQEWALRDAELASARELLASLPAERGHRAALGLFSAAPVHPDGWDEDGSKWMERLRIRRVEAMERLLSEHGLSEVEALAASAEEPGSVGAALAESQAGAALAEAVFPWATTGDPKLRTAARAFFSTRDRQDPEGWIKQACALPAFRALAPRARGFLLSGARFRRSSWEQAAAEGREADEEYWRSVWGYPPPPADELAEAVTKLLGTDRPGDAVRLLGHDAAGAVPARLAVSALDRLAGADVRSVDGHWASKVLARLHQAAELPLEELAQLELRLYGLTSDHAPPRALYELLSKSGEAFAEIAALLYRRDDHAQESSELPEERRSLLFSLAYRLLGQLDVLPGGGAVDPLRAWVAEARAAFHASGRSDIGDFAIGQLLGRAARDGPDELFPQPAVRAVLDDPPPSPDLERGFINGVLNSRGVTTRSLAEGGAQERELAAWYSASAARLSPQWPRTGAALRQIAGSYEEEARRHDEQARGIVRIDLDQIVDAHRGATK